MSSVPMASAGEIAGLGEIGCNANSDKSNSPQSKTCKLRSVPSEIPPLAPPKSHTILREQPSIPERKTPRQLDGSLDANGRRDAPSDASASPTASPAKEDATNRIREVREQQGVSIRSMARRMQIDIKSYKALENPSYDLTLSELNALQSALDVPLADLIVDRQGLASPVQERAKLVKVMKTAVAIQEAASDGRVERMARMLCEQLKDIMPELEDVSGWPQFGARRGQSAIGKALSQPVDTSCLGLPD